MKGFKYFIAILNVEYVRNSQIWDSPHYPSCEEEPEENWKDVLAPIVLWQGLAHTKEDVLERIHTFYDVPDSAITIHVINIEKEREKL